MTELQQYRVVIPKHGGHIDYYFLQNSIHGCVCSPSLPAWYRLKALATLPSNLQTLQGWCKGTTMSMVQVQEKQDLTFAHFWDTYAYKHGVKAKAESLWKLLPPTDRINAIAAIQAYNRHLATTGTAKVYPERYLKYRRWENTFN